MNEPGQELNIDDAVRETRRMVEEHRRLLARIRANRREAEELHRQMRALCSKLGTRRTPANLARD